MINLPKLQSLIAPFATPTGPALFLANEFYQTSITAKIPPWLAISVAITTIVGVEFSGALMCYCAVESWQRQSKTKMVLAIIGTFIYTGIMFGGFMMLERAKGQIFGIMVLLTLVAYLGYAIYTSFETQEKSTELKIKETKVETNRINAETRRGKVELAKLALPAPKDAKMQKHICIVCKEEFDNPRKYAAHIRWKHKQ